MKVVKLATFTAYGTGMGFVTSSLGALALHAGAGAGRRQDVLDDAVVGAVGGAAVNFVAGAVAACTPRAGAPHWAVEMATSTLLVGALGGIVGTLLVDTAGDGRHVDIGHEFGAGALGTVIAMAVGAAGAVGLCGARLACCCCPPIEHRIVQLQAALLGRRPVSVDDLSEP